MRIVAGKHRGRKIEAPQGLDTRPTLDRVRENLFNILGTRVVGATFLDLFSGSGAIGIEAISRGAKTVVFADKSPSAVKVIKSNLALVKEDGEVFCSDYKEVIKKLNGRLFDIVYLDPPYEADVSDLWQVDLIEKGGRVVYEHLAENPLKLSGNKYIIVDERKYGIVTLSFLERKDD